MILLTLSRGKGEETVRLQLPASPAEIGETFAFLDRISLDTTATAILDVSSNVPVLYRCLYDVDVEDSEQFQKLQKLAERTEALSPAKAAIFSGALDAECVWNLEGALTVADRLDEYTLKGTASGNCMPSILCLNDQGGSAIACSENVAGTLRAQEHGHQPLVFENHGIDARYTGPHSVAPTMSARYGTGGNNVPLVAEPDTIFCITGNAIDRQPMNGGNGIGYQQGIAYTLTATDHHAVFSRQRVDVFKSNEVVSTQSARQHKDATDLVVDMDEPDNSASAPRGASVLLIRRLTPLECERLQGFPDGWTDIEGASDSARYKALGNSVAIPCVDYVLQGIAWATTAQTA